MTRWMTLGAIGTAALLITLTLATIDAAGETASAAEPGSHAHRSVEETITVGWLVGAPRPAETDIVECNEYAAWIAEREARLDRVAPEATAGDVAIDDHRSGRRSLQTIGTLQGLAPVYRDDPRAEGAYRQCMVRRGYNVWG